MVLVDKDGQLLNKVHQVAFHDTARPTIGLKLQFSTNIANIELPWNLVHTVLHPKSQELQGNEYLLSF